MMKFIVIIQTNRTPSTNLNIFSHSLFSRSHCYLSPLRDPTYCQYLISIAPVYDLALWVHKNNFCLQGTTDKDQTIDEQPATIKVYI